ncbi:MAG: hypothetical protein HC868_10035 [Sphingomonadales bacterium]|nr:hypothetical protein [Sphingomonadales bacterium]
MQLLVSLLPGLADHSIGTADEGDVVAYLAALLGHARDGALALGRARLFVLVDIHIRQTLGEAQSPAVLATLFGVSERTLHRIFADRGTTFERHMLRAARRPLS